MSEIRVLVVDDSALMRRMLVDILSGEEDMQVVGTAESGEEAVEKVLELSPDVVVLDILMPGMGGMAALREIMRRRPTPVVVFSSYERPEVTLESLEMGAVDFVSKSAGGIEAVAEELLKKVRVAATAEVGRIPAGDEDFRIVVLGASTGGPRALVEVLRRLPPDLPAAFIVVQHMPRNFTAAFARRLNRISAMEVKEAEDGELLAPGVVYVAPGGRHLSVERRSGGLAVRLLNGDGSRGAKPSVDIAMESAARAAGSRVIGVVLTGMGSDGARGLRAIREAGGATIAEDPSTCTVRSMPMAAIEAGAAERVLPLRDIAREMRRLLEERR
ncbi:MAG: chemotaxis response regulator protein-glutamate methylesterase [Euryarchaeota archaeon]|nr:chemotaxis response regulator protein-glutamate methylesterase [Euryarchaeota archaeon]